MTAIWGKHGEGWRPLSPGLPSWIAIVVAMAIAACGGGSDDDAVMFGVAGGFVAEVPGGWTVVAPLPVVADAREPGAAGDQPLIAAFSPTEQGAGVSVFADQSGKSIGEVSDDWEGRFAVDIGDWSETSTRGLIIRSTQPVEMQGPGPGGFMAVHVVKVDGTDESWVLQCTGPDEDSARCSGVIETIVPG